RRTRPRKEASSPGRRTPRPARRARKPARGRPAGPTAVPGRLRARWRPAQAAPRAPRPPPRVPHPLRPESACPAGRPQARRGVREAGGGGRGVAVGPVAGVGILVGVLLDLLQREQPRLERRQLALERLQLVLAFRFLAFEPCVRFFELLEQALLAAQLFQAAL